MHSQLIPGLPIQSFGLCIALGVLLSWQILQRLYKKEDMSNLLFLLVFVGLIGARITHVVEYWQEDGYARNPLAVFEIWKGGLVFYGGLVAGAVAFLAWCILKGRSIVEMADTVAVVVPLAHAFGRLGCFFHGCCWGKVSDSSFAVTFPAYSPVWAAHRASDYAARSLPVLPVQLFEATLLLVLFGLLEYNMRSLGAEGTSFATICAFGAHAAVPHHITGDTALKFGDEILLDFGCKVNGYCSDITRTVLFGDDGKHEEFKKAYDAVFTAHNLVLENTRSGMTGIEVDAIARNYLKEQGYGDLFTHSLGHGIGLNVHEMPSVSIKGENALENGMIFSNEPGVYVAGEYGIRIEDTVRLENGKIKSFMGLTKKELVIL